LEVQLLSFLIFALDDGEWSYLQMTPCRCTCGEEVNAAQ